MREKSKQRMTFQYNKYCLRQPAQATFGYEVQCCPLDMKMIDLLYDNIPFKIFLMRNI